MARIQQRSGSCFGILAQIVFQSEVYYWPRRYFNVQIFQRTIEYRNAICYVLLEIGSSDMDEFLGIIWLNITLLITHRVL